MCLLVSAYINSNGQRVLQPNIVTLVDSVIVPSNMVSLLGTSRNIQDLKINRSEKYPDGAVYITLKDRSIVPELKKARLLSLGEITDKHVSPTDKGKPILYVLDGKLLADTANIRLSAAHYFGVEIYKASETRYFKQALPNVLLLMISTIETIK